MKVLSTVLASLASISLANASTIVLPRDGTAEEYGAVALAVAERALADSPSGGYAPASVSCPADRPTIREARGLSANETAWLPIRRNQTIAPMTEWLTRMNISGFDAASYINRVSGNASTLPNIGIAVSGIGGLLQAATYVAGLSGGGWLVGSIYTNNFTSVETLRDGSPKSSVWQFGNNILEGPDSDGLQIFSSADYYATIESEVNDKQDAGFNASLTDYWGRALSYQLVNATDGGPAFTFSSISDMDNFLTGDIPMPFLVTDSRAPNTKIISLNSTVYEINPFEIGSWDPTTYGFAPTRYVGSNFSGGIIPDSEQCIRGFDNVGYVMGTSSTLFNQFLLQLNTTVASQTLRNIFQDILDGLSEGDDDVAQWQPNPFYGFNNDTNRNAQSSQLTLVDGGEDNQNIPLYPLIQPVREVDVIFAIDSSADTPYAWPNGSSLVATYERSLNNTVENGTAFPSIPDFNTFINLGLNNRPAFFGCNSSNMTGPSPLIIYISNAPYITPSNQTTFTLSYNNTFRNAMIENGYDVATQGNGTIDSQWPTCIACAVLSRSFEKTGETVPDACTTCFNRYCWNGDLNSTTPASYEPAFKFEEVNIQSGAIRTIGRVHLAPYGALLAAVVAAVLL
ncbi:Phospholipase B 1 [Hyphodiscus hymeniophilus]|uniref:Lysophospholipase n=1 Tax=Hyphodiscus hymeniophilus TaxID=353542 RepID=A0A9P6VE17_9HELO|nr:Phospholipase B 1 [Hyphodiscus hymeniophilus]